MATKIKIKIFHKFIVTEKLTSLEYWKRLLNNRMTPGVNYVIYGCSFARTTPRVSLYWSLALEENFVAVITQDRVIDGNLKKQTKIQILCTCRLFPLI